METLVSATRINAEMLGLLDELGTVEADKLADLIVVSGNPLDDLGLFRDDRDGVDLVMKEGRIYKDRLAG
jgi:imidazolonepropionase-like amidohydrolase